jgi:hypothetical protein
VILLGIFNFSTGVNVTPLAQPHITGILATPGLAARFIQAVERGRQVNTDLSDDRDYWPVLQLPWPKPAASSTSSRNSPPPLKR